MLNRMNRVIRACAERGAANPICSIHDQGCGGNGNVLKEIVEGHGARYSLGAFTLGDPTLTADGKPWQNVVGPPVELSVDFCAPEGTTEAARTREHW